MSDDRSSAWRHRVVQLVEQGRFGEAEAACGELLRQDPDDAGALHLLAFCQYRQEGREPQALATVERVIALEPDESTHHALRANVLAHLRRLDEALAAANEAIRLDPGDPEGYTSRGWVKFRRERWAEAEQDARAALELDPDRAAATFLLSESLRLQGREGENVESVGVHLRRDPLDPAAHVSAGWAALQRGETKAAEEHFLEALRLDPRMEMARFGLLESFKSRAPWYRVWLRLNLWAARFSGRNRLLVMLGLFALVRFGSSVFRGPLAPVGLLLTVLWLGLALWSHLASCTANTMVLLDARARHALRPPERRLGLFAGGAFFAGVACMVAGLFGPLRPLGPLGAGLFGASIPFAHTFTNASNAGRWVFGAIGALALIAGLTASVAAGWPELLPDGASSALTTIAVLAVVASTWLVNVPALKE